MKKLCLLLSLLAVQPATDPEAAAIRQAALDYIEGWYEVTPPAWSAPSIPSSPNASP